MCPNSSYTIGFDFACCNYTDPQTPFERVLAQVSVPAETKARLSELEKNINPFALKKSIETKLKYINKLLNQSESNNNEGTPA